MGEKYVKISEESRNEVALLVADKLMRCEAPDRRFYEQLLETLRTAPTVQASEEQSVDQKTWWMIEAQIRPRKGAQFWNGDWNDLNMGFCDTWQEGVKFVSKEDADKVILGRPVNRLDNIYSAEHAMIQLNAPTISGSIGISEMELMLVLDHAVRTDDIGFEDDEEQVRACEIFAKTLFNYLTHLQQANRWTGEKQVGWLECDDLEAIEELGYVLHRKESFSKPVQVSHGRETILIPVYAKALVKVEDHE